MGECLGDDYFTQLGGVEQELSRTQLDLLTLSDMPTTHTYTYLRLVNMQGLSVSNSMCSSNYMKKHVYSILAVKEKRRKNPNCI